MSKADRWNRATATEAVLPVRPERAKKVKAFNLFAKKVKGFFSSNLISSFFGILTLIFYEEKV